jgi:hypothetical protein
MLGNAVLPIWIVYPGTRIFVHPGSRIQQQQKKKRGKISSDLPFFCSHKYHKIVNYFIFEQVKKKFEPFY